MAEIQLPKENDPFGQMIVDQLEAGRLAQVGEGDTDLSALGKTYQKTIPDALRSDPSAVLNQGGDS